LTNHALIRKTCSTEKIGRAVHGLDGPWSRQSGYACRNVFKHGWAIVKCCVVLVREWPGIGVSRGNATELMPAVRSIELGTEAAVITRPSPVRSSNRSIASASSAHHLLDGLHKIRTCYGNATGRIPAVHSFLELGRRSSVLAVGPIIAL